MALVHHIVELVHALLELDAKDVGRAHDRAEVADDVRPEDGAQAHHERAHVVLGHRRRRDVAKADAREHVHHKVERYDVSVVHACDVERVGGLDRLARHVRRVRVVAQEDVAVFDLGLVVPRLERVRDPRHSIGVVCVARHRVDEAPQAREPVRHDDDHDRELDHVALRVRNVDHRLVPRDHAARLEHARELEQAHKADEPHHFERRRHRQELERDDRDEVDRKPPFQVAACDRLAALDELAALELVSVREVELQDEVADED